MDRVGVEDDFFLAGGDSIAALRMAFQVTGRLGLTPATTALFDHPTIARFAAHLAESGRADATEPLVPVNRHAALAASSAQRRLWFLDAYEPGGAAYNCATGLRLTGPLDHPRSPPRSPPWSPGTNRCAPPSPRRTAGSCRSSASPPRSRCP
ncbi:phosphopantetheine-binding protein [Streptomyces noursei]|nr:phosphopantetheine-binding protein [Streptomyces noursei]